MRKILKNVCTFALATAIAAQPMQTNLSYEKVLAGVAEEEEVNQVPAPNPDGRIGAAVPYIGVGVAYKIPCVSVITYSIPNSFKYLSASGT